MNNNEVEIAILKTKIDNISEDIKVVGDALTKHTEWEERYHKDDHEKMELLFNGLHKKIDNLDKKFAPKWIERAVYGIGFLIIAGFITAAFKAILK